MESIDTKVKSLRDEILLDMASTLSPVHCRPPHRQGHQLAH